MERPEKLFADAWMNRPAFVVSTCSVAASLALCAQGAEDGRTAHDHPDLHGEPGVGKETDGKRLVQFLKDCTSEQRVQLGQSLHMFPKVAKADFGKHGLPAYEHFADDPKKASAKHPIRPQTFNEVPAAIMFEAVRARRLDSELTTPYRILSVRVHTCFNEGVAIIINRAKINYHGMVQWVAGKKGVAAKEVESANTFDLTLPMAAYTGAASTVALLGGPVGWLIAAVAVLGGLTYFALADVDRTAAFVMTMNVIKASRGQADHQKSTVGPPLVEAHPQKRHASVRWAE